MSLGIKVRRQFFPQRTEKRLLRSDAISLVLNAMHKDSKSLLGGSYPMNLKAWTYSQWQTQSKRFPPWSRFKLTNWDKVNRKVWRKEELLKFLNKFSHHCIVSSGFVLWYLDRERSASFNSTGKMEEIKGTGQINRHWYQKYFFLNRKEKVSSFLGVMRELKISNRASGDSNI